MESGIQQIFAVNMKSWPLESGIKIKESGIPQTNEIRNPVPVIRDPQCGIQNPTLSWIPETTFINHLETDTGRKVMLHETIRNDHDDF